MSYAIVSPLMAPTTVDVVGAKATLLAMMHLVLSFLSSLEKPGEIQHYTSESAPFEQEDNQMIFEIINSLAMCVGIYVSTQSTGVEHHLVYGVLHTTPISLIYAPPLALLRPDSACRVLTKDHVKTLTECGYNSTTTVERETAYYLESRMITAEKEYFRCPHALTNLIFWAEKLLISTGQPIVPT
ncbi:Actin-2 [Echinococcus granulosus]|uniref:Actin-2 n=1 Tax=Echinococcus granulosus TaxID=6210 RepID=W6U9C7_ECHGR|nr:Actin-2 [Echinococcus granulosus]EUB55087.1 Actin-2 [Echinococcus granulosus]